MTNARIPISITPDQRQALLKMSEKTGNSMSAIVRTALNEYIAKQVAK